MQSNAGFEVTVITGLSSYLPHKFVDIGWRERAARFLLMISPDFEKIRSQGTVVAGVQSRFWFQQ